MGERTQRHQSVRALRHVLIVSVELFLYLEVHVFRTLPILSSIFNRLDSFDVTAFAASECHDKQTCPFVGNNDLMGDPCPTIIKYTLVDYVCKQSKSRSF